MAESVRKLHDWASDIAQLRTDLVCAYHILDMGGQGSDIAGHCTARAPGDDRFWTHPLGLTFEEVELDDLHQVDFGLNILHGDRTINLALAFHAAIYRARPDVNCVVHTHPLNCVALGALGRNLEIISQEGFMFLDDVSLCDEYGGDVSDKGEATNIAKALGSCTALLLKNHGIITVGKSVRDATLAALDLELAASIQMKALSVGTPAVAPRHAASQMKSFFTKDTFLQARWAAFVRKAHRLRPSLIPESALSNLSRVVHL
jgi:L-fuculose-phosphate aldolase